MWNNARSTALHQYPASADVRPRCPRFPRENSTGIGWISPDRPSAPKSHRHALAKPDRGRGDLPPARHHRVEPLQLRRSQSRRQIAHVLAVGGAEARALVFFHSQLGSRQGSHILRSCSSPRKAPPAPAESILVGPKDRIVQVPERAMSRPPTRVPTACAQSEMTVTFQPRRGDIVRRAANAGADDRERVRVEFAGHRRHVHIQGIGPAIDEHGHEVRAHHGRRHDSTRFLRGSFAASAAKHKCRAAVPLSASVTEGRSNLAASCCRSSSHSTPGPT